MPGPVQIRGLTEVNRQLRKLSGPDGKKAIRRGMRGALKPMAAAVKEAEPQGATGTLRKAVKVLSGRSRGGKITLRIVIGSAAFKGGRFYGAFRDLGTRKLDGSGAMRETFDRRKEEAKADAERRILAEIMAELKG